MRSLTAHVVRVLSVALLVLSCAPDRVFAPTTAARVPGGLSSVNSASTVVISQVYGGGGNSGAPYQNDFIELFNRSASAVDVSGWSVQYASAAGSFNAATPISGTIPAGGYLLVQEAAGTTVIAPSLPTPDASGTINMSGTAGKVALVRSTAALACGTTGASPVPCSAAKLATIADLVGYGTAGLFEGSGPAAAPSNTTASIRLNSGCTDTDDNKVDFLVPHPPTVPAAPEPKNSTTPPVDCSTMVPAEVASVAVRVSWVTPGTSFKVTAAATDKDGKPAPTTFTWSSDRTSIATVDAASGVVTGGSVGIATLTATASNGVSGSAPLFVVNEGDVASISISVNDPVQAPAGFTKPAFPTTKTTTGASVTPDLVWTSSDPTIATVSDLGYITGVAAGVAKIRATAPDGVYSEVPFTVIPADAATTANYGHALEFGAPADNDPSDDLILTKRQYTESYNQNRGGPNWVSWDLNASQFGAAPRCDCFSADQTLPSDVYHVVDFDYRNGGYDRGHMVQSESRTTTDQENASTFLLTNILPQGAENNQGPWSKFENYLNDRARGVGESPKEIYVMAGGYYSGTPATLKGEGHVAIPDYTWKIAVVLPAGEGLADVHSPADLEVIAVQMPNLTAPDGPASSVGIRNNPWEDYKTTVHKIEAETGYDFLNKLPRDIQQAVEGDHAPVAVWGGSTKGIEGTPVTFDGTGSTDADNDALTYTWDFQDGTTATGASVTHTFADNSAYQVKLTVTDPSGLESSEAKVVTIANAAPVVNTLTATPSVQSGETVSALASFTDAGVNDAPWAYSFNWGVGNTSIGSTADQFSSLGSSRAFLAAGTYSVSVTVTDKDGAESAGKSATFRVLRIPTSLLVSPDRINLQGDGSGQIVATVLGTSAIDVSAIDLASVRIGSTSVAKTGAGGFKAVVEDVNGDGLPDLTLHFDRATLVRAGQLTSGSTSLAVQANLRDGRQIEARGSVSVTP
jgi:DNA/RNA endonuclease G (NUC1)/PKD repeat protein